MCETGHNNMTFTTVEQKIAWEYLEAYLRYSRFCIKQLKTAYCKHFEHFPAIEKFKKLNLTLQTTVNMCEAGHNNMTFTLLSKKLHVP